MSRHLHVRVLITAVVVVVVAVILYILVALILPAGCERSLSWVIITVVGVVGFLAAVSQLTGITVREIIEGRRERARETVDEQRAQRNRQAMLKLVKDFWVKGVLEQSLHGAVMIELGLEEQSDAVAYSWDTVLQKPDHPPRLLPRGTRILEVFEEMNRTLLILGEPGSGKTTMLLQLARDMIGRAEQDPTQPIPVVLNLSSWAEKEKALSDWLADELNAKYNVPNRIGRDWVENDELLLLLDGLDEVKSVRREACIQAINRFREEHGFVDTVVCSRTTEYEALTARLRLHGAIILQPLTHQQIDEYLKGAGTELLAVRKTLEHDTTLQELAQSPLFLSVMTLAYKGMSVEDLGSLDSIEGRRKHLFDAYVRRMFEHRGSHKRYSPEQTTLWLAWLAKKMSQRGQSVFIIEQLQPTWLQTRGQQLLYGVGSRLTLGLIAGLLSGLLYGLLSSLYLAVTVLGPVLLTGSLFAALVILGVGLLLALVFGLVSGLRLALPLGLGGLIVGLLLGLINARKYAEEGVKVIEALEWSWVGVRDEMEKRRRALLRGAKNPGALSDPGILPLRMTTGLASALSVGLRGVVTGERTDFNRGVRQCIKHSAIGAVVGAMYGVICSLLFMLGWRPFSFILVLVGFASPSQPLHQLTGEVFAMLASLSAVLGPIFGMIGGLRFGGLAFTQHVTIRFILWLNGHIPWNYARFLDYAAEQILLRKVGGGYIFIHRLLQEHFAVIELDQGRWGVVGGAGGP